MTEMIFISFIYNFFSQQFSASNFTSIEFLLPTLLATTAHFLGNAEISLYGSYRHHISIYTGLIGYPSSGKSTAMNLTKEITRKIFQFNNFNHSRAMPFLTELSLDILDQMQNKSNVLGIFNILKIQIKDFL